MYLWLIVFWPQPHKEERFLFPIYPLLCMAAAISVEAIQKLWCAFFVKLHDRHYLEHTKWISTLFLVVTSILSISRIGALYHNFRGSMDIWWHVNDLSHNDFSGRFSESFSITHFSYKHFYFTGDIINVCVGKEWYRFPSNFFISNPNWNLQFIQSEFKGQLPQHYAQDAFATRLQRPNFNRDNREEPSRYVNVSKRWCCHI